MGECYQFQIFALNCQQGLLHLLLLSINTVDCIFSDFYFSRNFLWIIGWCTILAALTFEIDWEWHLRWCLLHLVSIFKHFFIITDIFSMMMMNCSSLFEVSSCCGCFPSLKGEWIVTVAPWSSPHGVKK